MNSLPVHTVSEVSPREAGGGLVNQGHFVTGDCSHSHLAHSLVSLDAQDCWSKSLQITCPCGFFMQEQPQDMAGGGTRLQAQLLDNQS